MAEVRKISDKAIIDVANVTYGTRETALFYARQAKQAADKAKLDIIGEKQLGLSFHAGQMIEAIDKLHSLLNDDNKSL